MTLDSPSTAWSKGEVSWRCLAVTGPQSSPRMPSGPPTLLLPAGPRQTPGFPLLGLEQIGRGQDEDLADHVGLLLVAAHEPDHASPGRPLDDLGEARAHDLLELHPLLDHRRRPPTLQQRLLHPREPTPHHAHHDVVVVIGLRLRRP